MDNTEALKLFTQEDNPTGMEDWSEEKRKDFVELFSLTQGQSRRER